MRKSPFFDELFAILAVVAFFSQSINAAGVSYGQKFTSENNANNMLDIDTHSDLSEHPKHRLTRSITNSSDKFETIERNIEKMNERISRVKNSPSFNADDSSTVEGLQIIVDHLKEDLKTLKKQPELKADVGLLNEKLENLTLSFRVVQTQLINLQTREENEAKKQLPDDVVRHLQSHEFALAEEALKKGNNGTYIYAVKKVYDHDASNFDLLIRFGDFVREVDEKWKIYDALYHEIVSNAHNDTQRLLRLSQSIQKEIIDRAKGCPTAIAAESLYDTIWSVIQDEVVNQITAFLLNNQLNIQNLINEANFQKLVNIYGKAIKKVWGKLSMVEILDRAQNYVKNINAQIAFQVAVFDELEFQDQLYQTQNAVPLARRMKLTMDDVNYNLAGLEARSQHELRKNKLPESVKNIVFSSAVCMKNIAYKEYLFAKSEQYDDKRREVFTWIPGTINEPPKFKWIVEFLNDYEIKLRNYNYEEYLYGECGAEEFKHYDEFRDYVFTKKPMPGNINNAAEYTWKIEVNDDGMWFENKRGNQYLLADRYLKYDGKIRPVFTNRYKYRTADSKWQIIDCSKN